MGKIALLARLLIFDNQVTEQEPSVLTNKNNLRLDWHSRVLPLITERLQDLSKLRIDIHLPKSVDIYTFS